MMLARRKALILGGGALAALAAPRVLRAQQVETIEMHGTARGAHVWFSPQGLAVPRGTTIRFVNRDTGNSHTSTAYHPDVYGRQQRIPGAATPWDSEFLLPDESFEVTLWAPGVHDYYCIPHEMAGMVGRIVVGSPDDPDWQSVAPPSDDLSPETLAAFPPVAAIVRAGHTEQEDGA